MKVRWLLAAAVTIAAYVGGPATATAQDDGSYQISDVGLITAVGDKSGCDDCGAEDACGCGAKGGCDPCEPWRLFPAVGRTTLTGWMDIGATANADSPVSRYNGVTTFNDRDETQINQVYAVLERSVDTSCGGVDWGGRVDVLFGTDYIFTQATGLETTRGGMPKWNNRSHYGIALPQAYAEVGMNDLSVKIGHFYTIIGNETVTAPDNFFYSHAYTMQYGEPFTHTGVLATYDYSDSLDLALGVHNGWDNFDALTERAGIIGGAFWSNYDESVSLAATFTSGDELNNRGRFSNRSMYSLVGTFQLTDDLTYIIQHDSGLQKNDLAMGVDSEWYGLNQYLIYTINECWAAGFRGEWFRDDDGVRVTGIRANNPANGMNWVGDFYEITLGLNWTPCANMTIRPELRWDWFEGVGTPFNGNLKNEQMTAAVDAIILW